MLGGKRKRYREARAGRNGLRPAEKQKAIRTFLRPRVIVMKTIGIVGCGAIGKALLKAIETGQLSVRAAGVTSRKETGASQFLSTLRSPPPYLRLAELIEASDLIVEAAGAAIVPSLAQEVFSAGKDLMIISVGALLDHPWIIEKSRASGCHLYCPSGAIAGLDGIKSASIGYITRITHTSRKPPQALDGAPYLIERDIKLADLQVERKSSLVPHAKCAVDFPRM